MHSPQSYLSGSGPVAIVLPLARKWESVQRDDIKRAAVARVASLQGWCGGLDPDLLQPGDRPQLLQQAQGIRDSPNLLDPATVNAIKADPLECGLLVGGRDPKQLSSLRPAQGPPLRNLISFSHHTVNRGLSVGDTGMD